MTQTTLAGQLVEAARKYHDNHHWVPLRLKKKSPDCMGDGWNKRTLDDAIPEFSDGDNIGILLGKPSGNLVRLDPDWPAVDGVTDILWPEPTLVSGRLTAPRSGRFITCDIKSKDFTLPTAMENQPGMPQHNGKPRMKVFQILGTKKQTMAPPSIHPDTGEEIKWQTEHEPAALDAGEVSRRVGIEAFLMVVRHFWPARGTRNEAAIALSRVLLEALAERYPDDEERITVVDELVVEVAMAGGDGEQSRAGKERARGTLEKMRAGEETTGMTTLLELLDLPKSVMKVLWKWLGTRSTEAFMSSTGFALDPRTLRPIARSQHNIRNALELLGVELSYDLFHDRMLITGMEGHTIVGDAAVEELWLTIDERFRFLPPMEFFRVVISETARRGSFHPVRDYLDGLMWDGTERLEKWLVTYCGAEDTKYIQAVGAITLVAAVRRIRRPGCKFDEMMVLEGPQGGLKSELLSALAVDPDWFSDDLPLNASSQKTIEQTQGKWIIEAAEMSGMRRADIEHVKAFLSRQVDRSRLAYGRLLTEQPRQSIVVGTTNSDKYLKDLTGNRRFWPVKTGTIDLDAIKKDRDQLWAEASVREASGASIRLDKNLWDAAATEQTERTVNDPWIELLGTELDGLNGKLLSTDAWKIVNMAEGQRTQAHNERLGNAMKAIGFERKHPNFDGRQQWGYVRGDKDERLKRIFVSRYCDKLFVSMEAETVEAAVREAEANELM
jgi:hypothetical protein